MHSHFEPVLSPMPMANSSDLISGKELPMRSMGEAIKHMKQMLITAPKAYEHLPPDKKASEQTVLETC